jgi:heme-degrading monooxygenase HmoA
MIARIWKGEVPRIKRKEYFGYIKETGLPGLKNTKGNLGVQIFIRDFEATSHFMIVSFWDSEESIKKFTGPDYNKARLYPDDNKYLLSMEPIVHYEVLIER